MTKRKLYATWGIVAILAPILAIMATPLFVGKVGAMAFGASFGKLGVLGLGLGTSVVTDPPPGAVTLATKNRAATELRQQAAALQAEIADTTKPLTMDELKTKTDTLKALLMRAQAIAEFTPDAEIQRQGGTGGVVERVDSPEAGDNRLVVRSTMHERIKEFAEKVKREFGDVRSYLATVVSGRPGIEHQMTEGQRKCVDEAKVLTRAITGAVGSADMLLPLTQAATIFSLANVQQGLLQRARAYNVPGRSLRIPYLMQTDEEANATTANRPMAGQIANIGIVGEGSTKPVREPRFGQRILNVFKYAAITQVSDEILSDDFTGELPQEFVNMVGQQTLNAVNEDITISGSDATGMTTPAGALLAGQAYNMGVARANSNQIGTADIFNMYSRHTHGPNSFWLASRRTIQQLYALNLTSGSMVTFIQNFNSLPTMMLLGYPVILTDILPTLGATGDFALLNPDFYAFALRQALTVESSRDFAFTQDITTYRFIVRAGGIPINTGKYAYKYAGTAAIDEHAPFVYLNA